MNFDVIVFSSNFVGHPNFKIILFIFNVGEGIDFEFLIRELVSKSCFLEIDGKRMDNLNNGGQKMSKDVKLQTNNDIDECNVFRGFDTRKCIVNIFEDETFVEDLVNKLSFFLQLAKEDDNLYPLTMIFFFHLFNFVFVFCN